MSLRVRWAHVLHTLFLNWIQSWISPQICSYVSGMPRILKKTIMSICGPSFKVSLSPGRTWNYSYLQFSSYSISSVLPTSFKKDWRQQKLNCEASSSTRRKGKEIFSACFVRTGRISTLLQTAWQQWGSLLTPFHLWGADLDTHFRLMHCDTVPVLNGWTCLSCASTGGYF